MITLDSLDLEKISPEELGEILVSAKKAYYTTSRPIMDDHTYDTLEEILRQKNPHHRIFSKVGTPNFDTGFDKQKHLHPMFSQNKVNTFADLVHYFELKKIPQNTQFVTQPKCDGLSLELIYQNGRITNAITRGNGRIGDSILQNVVKMENFVATLPQKFSGSIRCEIVVTFKNFIKLNNLVKKKVLPPLSKGGATTTVGAEGFYSNARNAASGLSQRLDSKYCQLCTLLAVDIVPEPQTEFEKSTLLDQLGIKTVETHLCQNFSDIEKIYQKFLQSRLDYPFDIDGIVVKINNLDLAQKLGSLNNRPKFQVAYKFPAAVNSARLLSVDWQTGPLGNITPVAKIEPVQISGAIINFVSLANFNLIKELNLNIGDIVEVSRRGDVIPHIDKIITKVKAGHLIPPAKCSHCHSRLVTDHKFIRCPNRFGCPAQTLGVLRLFCKTLDILGISNKTIEKLSHLVKLPGDFYDLTVTDFLNLAGLGQKSGQNIVAQIQAKRKLTLIDALTAASIPCLSRKRLIQIIKSGFDTPQKIIKLTIADLLSLPGFKITLATKIIEGLTQRRDVIDSILSRVEISEFVIRNSKLSNLSFAITGDLSIPRKQIETQITQNGGKILSTVSQNTSYLIANSPSSSSKYIAAKKLGVKIINESDFKKLV